MRLRAVTVAATVALVLGVLAGIAAPAPAPSARYFRLVQDAGGHMHVEHLTLSRYAKVPAGVEADSRVTSLDDPNEHAQWGLSASRYESAWPTTTGSGVTVAVIDSGV